MKRTFFLLTIVLIYMPVMIYAEELHSRGHNRYATNNIRHELGMKSGGRVVIISAEHLSGSIKIIADSDSLAMLECKKILKTSNKNRAIDFAELINIDMHKTPDGIRIVLQAPNPAPWSGTNEAGQIEGTLHIPADCYLEIDAPLFDLDMKGPFGAVENEPSYGKIEIQKVARKLSVSGYNRTIRLKEISGEIYVESTGGDIRIEKMNATGKPARIMNENGKILLNDISGNLDISNSYGQIRIINAVTGEGESHITGTHSMMKIEYNHISKSSLAISNSYEDINLFIPEDISTVLDLEVEEPGEMHVEGLSFSPQIILDNRLQLITGGGGGRPDNEISISVEGGGNISIEGIKVIKK